MKYDACSGNGDDFFEDTANAECDDGSALEESEFGSGHEEGEAAGKEKDEDTHEDTFCFHELTESLTERPKTLHRYCYNSKADEHDWREEEDTAEWVACCGVSEEEDLGESPSKAGEEGSGDDEDEAKSAEVYLAGDHHDDTNSHGGYNKD